MSSLQEKLERAEITAHVSAKHIGLTIALIGVLIALCASMAGSEHNELTRTMTEQTQANSDYSGSSTKFRMVMVELEKLRHEASLGSLDAGFGPELKRLLRLYLDYSRERDFARHWVDSYQPAVETHFDATRGYDHAQLFAEIGIVIASLAVLLSNRRGTPLHMPSAIFNRRKTRLNKFARSTSVALETNERWKNSTRAARSALKLKRAQNSGSDTTSVKGK